MIFQSNSGLSSYWFIQLFYPTNPAKDDHEEGQIYGII